jgi:hypothetical protein
VRGVMAGLRLMLDADEFNEANASEP